MRRWYSSRWASARLASAASSSSSKIFDEEDEAADASLALAHREEYQRRMAEWREWRAAARKKLADARAEAGIAALPARGTSTEHTAEVQEWIEEVLEEKEETLP